MVRWTTFPCWLWGHRKCMTNYLYYIVGINENIQLNFIPYTDFSHLYEDPRHRKIDISKAKYLFGYQPKISLENGMQMQVEWFKNNLKKIQKLNPSFSTN